MAKNLCLQYLQRGHAGWYHGGFSDQKAAVPVSPPQHLHDASLPKGRGQAGPARLRPQARAAFRLNGIPLDDPDALLPGIVDSCSQQGRRNPLSTKPIAYNETDQTGASSTRFRMRDRFSMG